MKLLLSIPIPILVSDNNYLFKKGIIPTLRRALEMGLNNQSMAMSGINCLKRIVHNI